MKSKKCFKVNIGLIHHVESIRLRCQCIKLVAVMPLAVRDMDIAGMLPLKSNRVCILTAPLLYFPKAHVASLILVDMVVESSAYITLSMVI